MNSIRKNFVYNLLYQILVIMLPFITVPYISRVLGAEGIGIFSYTYSVVYYFMLITLLGINNHGSRVIAKVRDDKKQLSKSFLSMYLIQLLSGILMIFAYIMYMLVFNKNYIIVSWIQIIYLISAIFDINWFFFGLEEFKITVTRNTLVKIVSLVFIFIFVRDSGDVFVYTLIMALSTLVSQLLLIPFLLRRITIIKVNYSEVKKHIKPVIILFIPVIVVSVYTVMDKIMLGLMTSVSYVGIYEQADKIIKIPLCVITALGTVMLPRISNLVSKGDKDKVIEYIEKSVRFMMFLAFPMWLGMIVVSDKFIPIFLGEGFEGSVLIVKIMCCVVLFISFANITRTQYLIPYERDKDYIVSTSIGAIVNLILNIILIPKYQAVGACIGTVFAELSVMLYQCYALRKELPLSKYFKICVKYFFDALIMFAVIEAIEFLTVNYIVTLILQIFIGALIYAVLNYKYIKSIIVKKNLGAS